MAIDVGVRVSGLLISEEIGRGGFSRVFRAEPEGGGPAVAVKVAVRPELVHALRAEGECLRRLQGPHFVQILEEHLDQDPPYFVLELCPGGDLAAARAAAPEGRLPVTRVLELARAVLAGVAFAHEEGLVHGDLKPENLLLDAAGRPKIADLGLSRARRKELLTRALAVEGSLASAPAGSASGAVRGTFDYLAPEARATGELTPATDVFALGVALYELVVGARPLGLFRAPSEVLGPAAGVPRALDRAVERALAHDPRDRYPDARAMLMDLEAGDAGLPMSRPAPPRRVEGPNPLLLAVEDEAALDMVTVMVTPAALYAVIPAAALLANGQWWAARCLVLVVLAALALLVIVHAAWAYASRRVLAWRTSRIDLGEDA